MNPAGNISDLEFLKRVFNLKGKAVGWAIVVETIGEEQRVVPGLWIKGSSKYLNIPERIFKPVGRVGVCLNRVLPAQRVVDGDYFNLIAKEYPDTKVSYPLSYVSDIYFRTWYTDELERQPLV